MRRTSSARCRSGQRCIDAGVGCRLIGVKGLVKTIVLAGLALVVVSVAAGAVYVFYPQNLARRPPQLDALRKDVLKQTHLEAEFIVDSSLLGEPQLDGKVAVVFPHVPPTVDKAELERTVRALVKEQLPLAKELDVRFGDNLRTQPLDRELGDESTPKRPQRSH